MDAAPTVILTVPKPPSLNKLWRHEHGRRKRSAEYAAWLREAGWEVKRQYTGRPAISCRFNIEIQVPISRRDTGNWEKPIGDLLEMCGVVTNDGNAHRLTVTPMQREDCAVAIYELPDMGNVRPPARKGWVGPARPTKPTRRRLNRIAALRGEVMF